MSEVVDRLGLGVAFADHETRVLAANANYARILGRSLEAVMGLSMTDVTHPDDVGFNGRLIAMAAGTGEPFTVRKRYLLPCGEALWVENRVFALSAAPQKEPLYLVVSRRIDGCPVVDEGDARAHMAEYVRDVSGQLARMARSAGLFEAEELLDLASLIVREELGA
ncbi:PAS domain-containing protein [Caulobacter segnis]|uniref:PAS domain-containing protein n=1 Tax=Caulobacter segnis TaxID=88688 RepID=UPI00241056DB|nr:PAS domain-containing protein [Caulobacter segnis]MDG2522582.1 PAS domain-containing protein [Caulobacter segnis]